MDYQERAYYLPFVSLAGKKYELNIYSYGYGGENIQLRGCDVPFETQEEQDKDPFLPIRGQSGYMRVAYSEEIDIDVYDWHTLCAKNAFDKYLELEEVMTDGTRVCRWCGYMKAEQYTSEMYAGVNELELPILSPLDVLDTQTLNVDGSDCRYVRIRDLMKRLLEDDNVEYEHIYFTKFSDLAELNALVNLRTWIDDNDDYDFDRYGQDDNPLFKTNATYRDILEDILRMFGYTVHVVGKDLFFIVHAFQKNHLGNNSKLWKSEFSMLDSEDFYSRLEQVDNNIVNVSSLTMCDNDHTEALELGCRKVEVKSNTAAANEVFRLPIDDVSLRNMTTLRFNEVGNGKKSLRCFLSNRGATPNIPQYNGDVHFQGCHFTERHAAQSDSYGDFIVYDECEKEDYDAGKKKSISEKKGLLMLMEGDVSSYIYTTMAFETTSSYVFNGGYLCVSADIAAIKTSKGHPTYFEETENDTPFPILGISIGGHSWVNGNVWRQQTNIYERFDMTIRNGGLLPNAEIMEAYKYRDGLPSGFYIPVTERLEGKVTVILMAPFPLEEDNGDKWLRAYLIKKLSISYEPTEYANKEKTENVYSRTTTRTSGETKEAELKLYTHRGGVFGRNALLKQDGTYLDSIYYYLSNNVSIRPEEMLLQQMYQHFSSSRFVKEISVLKTDALALLPNIKDWISYTPLAYTTDWRNDKVKILMREIYENYN